jgi:hypothetical protein
MNRITRQDILDYPLMILSEIEFNIVKKVYSPMKSKAIQSKFRDLAKKYPRQEKRF